MKLIQKMKAVIAMWCAGVILIGILLIGTVLKHREEMDTMFTSWTVRDNYRHIRIADCTGQPIYDGDFSEDDDVRLSTFHLVGDRDGSIPEALLTKTVPTLGSISKMNGYTTDDAEISLTIDLRLQKAAYRLLSEEGLNGAIVAADYRTGEIKTLLSTPVVDVADKSYIPTGAFLNKATLTYPPGSVFKTVTAAAALEKASQAKCFSYHCTGYNGHIVCYDHTAHGQVSLDKALLKSCNCAISEMAQTYLSGDDLDKYAKGCGILSENAAADLVVREGGINANADLMWSANGQGEDMCSPVGVAAYYGAIANDGCFSQLKIRQETVTEKPRRIMSSYTSRFIIDALTPLCENAGVNCLAFGKTGTAELNDDVSHAWFACALYDEAQPPYVIVTFVEHGGFSSVAKDLAVRFINNYIVEVPQNDQ